MTWDSCLEGARTESLLKRLGRFIILPAVALIAIGLAVHSNVTHAADPKAGDAVEVYFLGEWRPGTVVATNAATVITAELKRGESQTITYRSFGIGGGGDDEETVTVTPHISTLKIAVNGKVAWQSGTSTGAPPVVRLKQGESAQEQVDKWQRPDVNFFDRTSIPDRILDPAKHEGLGTTVVTNRGLVAE
jgi:hypothetical protein